MQENLTEINNPLIKETKSKDDSGETTYNEENFPKSVTREEKIKKIKILQEKINSENNIIEAYDSQLENLRNNKYTQSPVIKKKSIFEKVSSNKTNKLINNLKLKNSSLYTKMNSLTEKENALDLNSSDVLVQNKNKDLLKKIKNDKEIILNKINDINNQIKLIMDKEKMQHASRYSLQKNYIRNIEEKNLFSQKLPKQIKTSPSSFLESLGKMEQRLENEKSLQEDKLKKEKYENLRTKELEIIHNRKKKIDDLLKISHPKYIPKKDYITAEENEQKRKREEEALIEREIKKRKMKLQPINSAELNKFSREVQKNEKMILKELGQKKYQMKQIWQERKSLLPEYRSKFMLQNMENEIKMKEENILKKERVKKEVQDRIKFGEEVMRNFQPQTNDKLKNQREENIKKLKGINKYKEIKKLGKKLKNISNKLILSQPKNFPIKKTVNEEENKRIIKILKPLDKPRDYLSEERIKKNSEYNTPTYKSYFKENKWEDMLNTNDNRNIYNNIEQIKMEAQILQNKADTKKKLLKNDAVDANNIDDVNNEISNLYIGSIKAKLKILKKIG